MNNQRVVLGTVLGLEDTLSSNRVEGIRGQTVDGLCGHADDLASAQELCGMFKDFMGMRVSDDGDGVLEVGGGGVSDRGWINGLKSGGECGLCCGWLL